MQTPVPSGASGTPADRVHSQGYLLNQRHPGRPGAFSGLSTEIAPRKHRRPGRGHLQRHRRPNAARPPPIQPDVKARMRKIDADHENAGSGPKQGGSGGTGVGGSVRRAKLAVPL